MADFDDLFTPQETAAPEAADPSFDKEAWAQKKQEQREAVYSMIDDTVKTVAGDGAKFQGYLDLQTRFDRYSVSNALLILAQRPKATRVADFDTWKEQGAYIRKRESGFFILEPGEEYKRDDGTTAVSYNPKKVFDVSQTGNARRRETYPYPDDRTRIKALMDHAPVAIHINDALPEGTNAIYLPEQREIQIRRGMDAADIFRSLSQELAHAEMDKGDKPYDRSTHTFHAYCASYLLCKQYGVNTDGYRFDRAPQMFEGMEPQQIRAELSTFKDAAEEISGRMNRTLAQQHEQKRQEPER
jgi:hypothetical protein